MPRGGSFVPYCSWRDDSSMPSRPGDRSPGFFVEPSRCWAMVYDHNLQSTRRGIPTHTGRWLSPRHLIMDPPRNASRTTVWMGGFPRHLISAGIVWQMFGYIVRSSSGIQLVTTRPVAVLLQKRRMGSPRRLDPVRS